MGRLAFKSVFDKKLGRMVDVTPDLVKARIGRSRPRKPAESKLVLPADTLRPKWPMQSIRGGVHPSQVEEMNEMLKAKGVTGARFLPGTGDAEWDSHASRRECLRATGQEDFSGYD